MSLTLEVKRQEFLNPFGRFLGIGACWPDFNFLGEHRCPVLVEIDETIGQEPADSRFDVGRFGMQKAFLVHTYPSVNLFRSLSALPIADSISRPYKHHRKPDKQ